jgi:antitoxin VapB
MGVQLNIKDARTVELARTLADRSGRSVTETIRAALERELADMTAEQAQRLAELRTFLDGIYERLPEETRRMTSREIMDELYDEDGAPI